jgi:hypothetical protein
MIRCIVSSPLRRGRGKRDIRIFRPFAQCNVRFGSDTDAWMMALS